MPSLNTARRPPQHAERWEFPALSYQFFNGHIHQIRHRFAAVHRMTHDGGHKMPGGGVPRGDHKMGADTPLMTPTRAGVVVTQELGASTPGFGVLDQVIPIGYRPYVQVTLFVLIAKLNRFCSAY